MKIFLQTGRSAHIPTGWKPCKNIYILLSRSRVQRSTDLADLIIRKSKSPYMIMTGAIPAGWKLRDSNVHYLKKKWQESHISKAVWCMVRIISSGLHPGISTKHFRTNHILAMILQSSRKEGSCIFFGLVKRLES